MTYAPRILKGMVAWVTGGASGLGKATVERLMNQGVKVAIADLPTSKGKELADILGENALFTPLNVTKEDEIREGMKRIEEKFGKLDILVNCAGIGVAIVTYNFNKQRPHLLEEYQAVLNVNLVGTFNMCRLAVDLMARNEPDVGDERGVIINTSSIAAYDGQRGQVAYAASKGGVAAMTLPMSRDLSRMGVRVMAIAPGLFDTPLLSSLPEKVRKVLSQMVPFPPRLGDPSEFAHLVQCIVENRYLNGEVIRIDGGLRMPD